jgi:hypothetical protein
VLANNKGRYAPAYKSLWETAQKQPAGGKTIDGIKFLKAGVFLGKLHELIFLFILFS